KKYMKLFKKIIKKLSLVPLILLMVIVMFASLRGNFGNPKSSELTQKKWLDDGPFELSPERGRFALTYSLLEDRSFYFSIPVAQFATPDLGFTNGKYVSLFA